jgi:hypothetical protein
VKVSRLDPLGKQEGQLEGGVVSDQRPGPKRLKDGPGDAAHIEDGRAPPPAIELAEPDAGALRIEAGPQRVLDLFREPIALSPQFRCPVLKAPVTDVAAHFGQL